ncbi:hypothetical protein N9973_00280 [bacterium]|nr:hypothetical protein [bacterium]
MSARGLHTILLDNYNSTERLSAVFDFNSSDEIGFVSGPEDAWDSVTGVFLNSQYANIPSRHSGLVLGSASSSETEASGKLLDINSDSKIPLTSGNFQVHLDGLNAARISTLIDFELPDGDIDDGVILGCFETGLSSVQGNEITISKGYNVGITDRGHLFCQTYGPDGDSINVITDIELSKRNVIGVSAKESAITISYFDYLNDSIKTAEIPVSRDFIAEDSLLTFGGANTYFRSTNSATTTFSGTLNNLSIFSGYIGPEFLKDLSEGLIGDYFFTPSVETTGQRVTGYSESITYKTGITGYDYYSTGTLEIITGREEFTGSASSLSNANKEEGERYYKYYTLNNGGVKTFYKEELGQLHSNSGYIYYPTGEDAYDTLGLNDISESIETYTEVTGMTQDKITIDLYGKTPLTGVLSEVSGFAQTALTESYTTATPASSGVYFVANSEDFKKDYIYYMGGKS